MYKNKGAIGLVLTIILGVIVVAGGAYYFGKNNSQKMKEININNQNINQVNNNQTENFSNCTQNSAPSIKVVYPNGAETFKVGDKITVKWESCNLANSFHLRATLQRQPPFPDGEWQIPILFGSVEDGRTDSSLNDGEQLVMLDSAHDVVPASYKLCISEYATPPGQNVISGCSDNSFTINSSLISTANWKTYSNTKYGFELKYPNDWDVSTYFSNADGFFFKDKSNKFTFAILPRGEFDHGYDYEDKPIISNLQINEKQVIVTKWDNSASYQFIDKTIPSTWITCGQDLKSCNRIEIQGTDQIEQDLINQILSTLKFIN
jgi:hypothetical protein